MTSETYDGMLTVFITVTVVFSQFLFFSGLKNEMSTVEVTACFSKEIGSKQRVKSVRQKEILEFQVQTLKKPTVTANLYL